MVDQAESLRQLATHAGMCGDTRPQGRVVVIVGAQPGAGATTTSVNLSIALTHHEASVVLIDADMEQPDAARRCGLTSRYTLKDLLEGRRSLREIQQVGPAGLTLLPGEAMEFDASLHRIAPLAEPLSTLADWIVIDAGRGLALAEIHRQAADVIVVTTSTPEAVMEAYAVVKRTVTQLTAARFWLIVSQTDDLSRAEDAQNRIAMSCDRFLNLPIHAAGNIPTDNHVKDAEQANRPVLLHSPTGPMSLAMETLALEMARTGTRIKSALACVSPSDGTL
jgi:flagellar biosynthesis protein FlhG